MDALLVIVLIGLALVVVAYRQGHLAGVVATLKAKEPAIEAQAHSWIAGLLHKAAPATPPAAAAPAPASPAAITSALSALKAAQDQLLALQAQGPK